MVGNCRNHDNAQDRVPKAGEVLLHHVAEHVTQSAGQSTPHDAADGVRDEKAPIVHFAHAGQARGDGTKERSETTEEDVEHATTLQLPDGLIDEGAALLDGPDLQQAVAVALTHELTRGVANDGGDNHDEEERNDVHVPGLRDDARRDDRCLCGQDEANEECGLTEYQERHDEVYRNG